MRGADGAGLAGGEDTVQAGIGGENIFRGAERFGAIGMAELRGHQLDVGELFDAFFKAALAIHGGKAAGFIGDQGDPLFWRSTLKLIGPFDALLDDGGHQSFQQIVTVYEAIRVAKNKCVIAVEDTATSFMKDFSRRGTHTFLEFSKDATDILVGKSVAIYPGRFPTSLNTGSIDHFETVYSIQFFNGLVAFKVDPDASFTPALVRNMPPHSASDFRYEGANSAYVDWPNLFTQQSITVKGGLNYRATLKKGRAFIRRLIK